MNFVVPSLPGTVFVIAKLQRTRANPRRFFLLAITAKAEAQRLNFLENCLRSSHQQMQFPAHHLTATTLDDQTFVC